MNDRMRSLLAWIDLSDLSRADLPPGFDRVVDAGWEREASGAWVLRALSRSYHGPRATWPTVINYEGVVNGRGITDHDLDHDGPRRTETLIRRTLSYVHAALAALGDPGPVEGVAFATVGMSWTEDPVLVAHATFWVSRENEMPYNEVDPGERETAMMSISSREKGWALGEV